MTKSEDIFMNEKYMSDVTSNILSEYKKKIKRREELSVWGPVELIDKGDYGTKHDNISKKVHGADASIPKLKIQKIADRREVTEPCIQEEKNYTFPSKSNVIPNIAHDDIEKRSVKPTEILRKMSKNENKRTMSESENEVLGDSCRNQALKAENMYGEERFQDWCSKRNKEYEEMKSRSAKSSKIIKQPTCINNSNLYLPVHAKVNGITHDCSMDETEMVSHEMNTMKKMPSPLKKHSTVSVSNNNVTVKDVKRNTHGHEEKLNNPYAAESPVIINRIKKEPNFRAFKEKSKSHYICIKVTDENGDKCFELTSYMSDISQVKKNFPKFAEVIPDIDSGSKEIKYCADAVNMIFRYMFNHSYKFSTISSLKIGVEVLSASQSWEIDKFYEIFFKDFRQALTPSNISTIFPYAYHFGLKEVCDACKSICPDNTNLNCLTYKRSKKTSTVSISTYVEPLELCLPFHPVEKHYTLSFNRHILNKIYFKVTSGCYIITGVQIQLNEDHLKANNNESNMLEIECSIKNVSNDKRYNQREKKHLRSLITMYFKKDLVVNPKEVGEITVETETMPYLCSAIPEQEMVIMNSKFNITMHSDFKVQGSNEKLFVIGKLLYREDKKNPKMK